MESLVRPIAAPIALSLRNLTTRLRAVFVRTNVREEIDHGGMSDEMERNFIARELGYRRY